MPKTLFISMQFVENMAYDESMQPSSKARILMWMQFTLTAGILIITLRGDYQSIAWLRFFAVLLFAPGCTLFVRSVRSLGKSLTPDPVPKSKATLVTSGVYAWVRHPIYTAVIMMSFGWSFFFYSKILLVLSALLFLVLNSKASFEELFLRCKFPEYQLYSENVGRLIPHWNKGRSAGKI